jgi:hypothetical protein
MYDETVKTVKLTSDEIDLLKTALELQNEFVISAGEQVTMDQLMEKLGT